MLVVFPLCGFDETFIEQGYHVPKPLISIHGKYMIYHMIDSLTLSEEDNVLCICPYNFKMFDLNHPKIHFIYLLEPTKGALHTCIKGLQLYPGFKKEELVLMDGDMLYTIDIMSRVKDILSTKIDCAITSFVDKSTRTDFSFITLDNNKVTSIAEKDRISDCAVSGCYIFQETDQFLKNAQQVFSDSSYMLHEKYYMSSVIKYMIEHHYNCGHISLETSHMLSCHSPNNFCHSLKSIPNGNRKMRFCFDLDGTLVTAPLKTGDYRTVQPILRNINYVRYLKSLGHTIIIHTARRMKTHSGNVGAVIRDIGNLTLDMLEQMDIPYDEIYFGKPYADFYIDDKAVPAYSQMQKMTGLYEWYNKVESRSFNTVKIEGSKITKRSCHLEKLNAEIYYYLHIPEEVKFLFPKMWNYSLNECYTLEYIESPTASILYITESLSTVQFMNILMNLKKIHTILPMEGDLVSTDIWKYYIEKLEERTQNLIDRFEGIDVLINHCRNFLQEEHPYSNELTMIHGDPVFTNILCKEDTCIFIDMRGTFVNQNTIYGHSIYDYAKIYQSLLGYDEIIHASVVSHYYKDTLLQIFWNSIPSEFEKPIKNMTLYLLITLLSLHEERVAKECYQLACELFYSI